MPPEITKQNDLFFIKDSSHSTFSLKLDKIILYKKPHIVIMLSLAVSAIQIK